MKGIYLTEEGKKEIESKITELRIINLELEKVEKHIRDKYWDWNYLTNSANKKLYQEILSSAIILPVEESWGSTKLYSHSTPISISKDYPNGVIINNDVK
jgi:hypothetical protein